MTKMPAFQAKQFGLPIPKQAAFGAIHKQTGLEIRAGWLRARTVKQRCNPEGLSPAMSHCRSGELCFAPAKS
jgi:hypothetical protein